MSDFTKADAEAAGWVFVHAEPEGVEDLGDGITRTTPASYRAEKQVTGGLVNEQAESEEKLVERIGLYEAQLVQKQVTENPPTLVKATDDSESVVAVEADPVAGSAVDSSLNEAIYDGEKMVHIAAGQVVEPDQGAWAADSHVEAAALTAPGDSRDEAKLESAAAQDAAAAQRDEAPAEATPEEAPPAVTTEEAAAGAVVPTPEAAPEPAPEQNQAQ